MTFSKMNEEFKHLSAERIKKLIHYYWNTLSKDYDEEDEMRYDYVVTDILEDLEPWMENNLDRIEFVYNELRMLNENQSDISSNVKEEIRRRLTKDCK